MYNMTNHTWKLSSYKITKQAIHRNINLPLAVVQGLKLRASRSLSSPDPCGGATSSSLVAPRSSARPRWVVVRLVDAPTPYSHSIVPVGFGVKS